MENNTMTAQQLQDWISLQLVGIDMLPLVTACQVRLGIEIQKAVCAGRADDSDYFNFENWHYAGRGYKAVPAWKQL